MQGSTTIRKWYSLLGVGLTLCAVGLLVSAGCQAPPGPGPGPAACDVNADCDDGLFCNGAETCVDGECAAAEDPCTADQECDEEADICQDVCDTVADCPDDDDACTDATCVEGVCGTENNTADCDDDEACTDGDVCADGACAGTAVECAEGEECDPATGECVSTAECNTNADCADDLYCNGEETCVDGACVDGTSPCDAGETCDEATDTCVGCATDADCDDGLFCTGTETCVNEVCSNGVEPCDATETCVEETNTCTANVETTFTLNLDDLTGSVTDDTFSAVTALTGLGVLANTLQSGDVAAGLGGTDTVNVILVNATGAALTIAPTLASIEVLNISDFATANTISIAAANITGATDINLAAGLNNIANAFQVAGLPAIVDASITNSSEDFEIIYGGAATTGSADPMTLTVSNSTDNVVADRSEVRISGGAVNGIESLTINAIGAANRLRLVTQAPTAGVTSTSLATLNITGSQNLQIGDAVTAIGALDNSILTVNASAFTGGITELTVGTGVVAFTGGTGNDTVIYGANYTTADTINGGLGTDYLGITSAAVADPATNQTNVTNIEGLRYTDALTHASTLSRWGSGVVNVILDAGAAMVATELAYPTGTVNTLSLGAFGTDAAGGGTLNPTVGGLGTGDALALTLNDADQTGITTITGAETVTLASNIDLDGSAASGAANVFTGAFTMAPTFGTGTVTISGTAPLTFTGATTIGTINAGSFTQVLTMSAASAIATTITGGSAADKLQGSALQDSISGGAGNDSIIPRALVDSIATGAGSDTVHIAAIGLVGVDRDLISDFTAGAGGDVLNMDVATAALTGTNVFTSSAAIQTHSTAGNMAVGAAINLVVVTAATQTNFTDAASLSGTNLLVASGGTITGAIVGANRILLAVGDASGNTGIYYATSADNAIIAAEISLIAVIQGVTPATLTFGNFNNIAIP